MRCCVASTAFAEELSSTTRTKAVGRGGNVPGSTGRHIVGKASNRYCVAPPCTADHSDEPLLWFAAEQAELKLLPGTAVRVATALAGLPLRRADGPGQRQREGGSARSWLRSVRSCQNLADVRTAAPCAQRAPWAPGCEPPSAARVSPSARRAAAWARRRGAARLPPQASALGHSPSFSANKIAQRGHAAGTAAARRGGARVSPRRSPWGLVCVGPARRRSGARAPFPAVNASARRLFFRVVLRGHEL